MDTSRKHYQIRIEGRIPERWQSWFDPFSMVTLPEGDTMLQGEIVDQSQLVGVINQLHSLNLKILSVNAGERCE